jgi:hypothetical protein
MLRRNMSTADCQKSGVEWKVLGLHSALFSARGDGNTRVNLANYGKNAKNRMQLVKFGYPQKVFCKQTNCEVTVVAANWPFSEERWSDWCIIDCSLLPGGALSWGMDCRSQMRSERK